mgnify:CR=1 FL=1
MSLKKNKDLKLYFSISEVAQMFDVNESTLAFGRRSSISSIQGRRAKVPVFTSRRISTRYASSTIWLKREDDLGRRTAKTEDNKETTIRQEEIVNRLKQIKEELLAMKTHSMLLPRKCDYSVDKTRTKPYLRPQLNKT